MSKLFSNRYRVLLLLVLTLVLATATYGFAAQNTVDASYAGEGDGLIGGFAITAVSFTLDPSDPTQFSGLDFTINPAPGASGEVRVGLFNGSTVTWLAAGACTASGTSVSCTGSFPVSVEAAVGLYVAATQ